MSIGQFMPLFPIGSPSIPDPYLANVRLALHCEDTGDGVTLKDSSPYDYSLTPYLSPMITSVEPKFGGGCVYFNNTGAQYSKLLIDGLTWNANWTIELWFKNLNTVSSSGFIFDGRNSGFTNGPIITYGGPTSTVRIGLSSGTSYIEIPSVAPGWHHVSLSRTGTRLCAYLDGILRREWNGSSTINTGCGFTLGKDKEKTTDNTTTNSFGGYVDEVRIWHGVAIRDGVNNFELPTGPWSDT